MSSYSSGLNLHNGINLSAKAVYLRTMAIADASADANDIYELTYGNGIEDLKESAAAFHRDLARNNKYVASNWSCYLTTEEFNFIRTHCLIPDPC